MISPLVKTVVAGVCLFCAGLMAGYWLYQCPKPIPEPPAPAIKQKDGSLLLERSPSGKPASSPDVQPLKPAGQIPKGAVVERNVEVIVQPGMIPVLKDRTLGITKPPSIELLEPAGPTNLADAFQCPEVHVNLSLIRQKDMTRRVIASSPDGKIIGGLDVPVSEPAFPKPQRWTVQALAGYDSHASREVFGGQVSYGRGPFTISAGALGSTGFVGAGIRF